MSLLQEVFTNLVVTLLADWSNTVLAKIWNLNDNFNSLNETLHDSLNELLQTLTRIHAPESRVCYPQFPSDWLDQLLWCHYEIEDVIDSINLAVSSQTLTTKFLQTHLNHVRSLHSKLQDVDTKLSLWQPSPDQRSTSPLRGRVSVSTALELLRVKDKEAIIRELKSRKFGVSIVGLAGTGKTKLAEAIAEDASIKDHFPCILSPPISPEFSLKSVLECINAAIANGGEKIRVLIMLDGVQSVNPEDWHQFNSYCLQNLHMSSKVLLTSQNPRVADVTGCVNYALGSLSATDCFSLIFHQAKSNENLCAYDMLAIINNQPELVEKCKGLPLLASHIGLLLSAVAPGSRDKILREIAANSVWKQSGLESVLHDLTPVSMLARKQHLQRCVTYCSLFPPEHEFERENLVQLWMMEGFTQAMTTTQDVGFLEKAANDCFDDLLSHSVFQASDEKPSVKMHQLLYDLAENLGSNTFLRLQVGTPGFALSPGTRHLSVSCENIQNHEKAIPRLLDDIKTCKGLRTFLLLHRAGEKITKNPTFFETLDRLRVLDLSHTNLTKLAHTSKLKHLRYLDVSHTPIKKLSPLSKHPALLVLKLNECDLLHCLPNDLSDLTNLMSLEVNMKSLGAMPRGIGKLQKLQNLNVFIVGKEEGYKIAELKKLNQLRESLCITKLENVQTKSNAQEAMLQNKNRLERLELQWNRSMSDESAKQVLEGLLPHKNLKELSIRKYSGSEFPEWLGSPQVCGMLKSIHLADCEACTALPSLGQLPMLRTLTLETIKELTGLSGEFFRGGFPCLESFKLCELPNLTEWTELSEGSMPHLRELQIVDCQRLVKLPLLGHLGSLESVEFHECPMLWELPWFSSSVKTLVITESDILRQRCQVEHLDWHKIRGINVVIDSERLDTGEQRLSAPNHEHSPLVESSSLNKTDSCSRLAEENHAHSLSGSGRDLDESISQQGVEQLPMQINTTDICQQALQMGAQHSSLSLTVHINQENQIIQQIPKSEGRPEFQSAKRMRHSNQMAMEAMEAMEYFP